MAREDKASATSSTQDAPSGKSGDQDSTSLAARRARLRGTLAKQTVPPDAYAPDPYQVAKENAVAAANAITAAAANEPAAPDPVIVPDLSSNGGGQHTPDNGADPLAGMFGEPEDMPVMATSAEFDLSPIVEISSEPEVPEVKEVAELSVDQSLDSEVSPVASPVKAARNDRGKPAKSAVEFSAPEVDESMSTLAEGSLSSSELESLLASVPSSYTTEPSHNALPMNYVDSTEISAQMSAQMLNSAATEVHQSQVIDLLNNLDQQLGICSVNMAQISKAANEQLDIVRNLAETIQHQAFNEIGLSLNSLSESMSAALEPMQAVGELVPAIDNLVTTLQLKGNEPAPVEEKTGLTPEELVHSLADQLSTGLIDPWTFKCAYMAVFPSEHPADLLRKLVDLLGAQRISGDFFRAAYDAVQAPDPPPRVYAQQSGEVREVEVVRVVQDVTVMAQIEELRQHNEEMRARLDAREGDFAEMLAAKDQEVQDTQEMLNSRWEEFSGQYEKLSDLVQQRNELIQAKESELSDKDSQIVQLKTQLDEMRDQTRDMVSDLQRQLTSTKAAADELAQSRPAAPKPSASFFEQNQPPAQPALFNDAPSKPLFSADQQQQVQQQQIQQQQQAQSGSQQIVDDPMQTQAPAPVDLAPQPQAASGGATTLNQAMPSQAIPRPQVSAPTTPFAGATGSYGSGVRAQVFEVIVRQALAGAPWREICAGPMQVNNISAEEVEAEVKRRQALLKK